MKCADENKTDESKATGETRDSKPPSPQTEEYHIKNLLIKQHRNIYCLPIEKLRKKTMTIKKTKETMFPENLTVSHGYPVVIE